MTMLRLGRKSLLVFHCVCISYHFLDIKVKEWRNLETAGRGRSRSLKMTPFDRLYLEKVTEGDSNWHHSKAWVQFPIHLP